MSKVLGCSYRNLHVDGLSDREHRIHVTYPMGIVRNAAATRGYTEMGTCDGR